MPIVMFNHKLQKNTLCILHGLCETNTFIILQVLACYFSKAFFFLQFQHWDCAHFTSVISKGSLQRKAMPRLTL